MVTIEELLKIGKENGASDVHITVGLPPKMRVNGELIDMNFPKLMPEDTADIINQLLSEKQRGILAKNGEADFSFSISNLGRYRVNVFNQRGSLAAAIRLVGTQIPKPEELGLPKSVIDLYTKKRGLILVTGPTGSGKSTTLASLINKINENRKAHIITLEDPIEYLHQHKLSMVLEAVISQQLIPTSDRHHRVAAFEVMLMSVAIKNLIRESKTFQIDSMIQTSKEKGMITMDEALYEHCMMGHISSEMAISFAQDPVALEKKIKIY